MSVMNLSIINCKRTDGRATPRLGECGSQTEASINFCRQGLLGPAARQAGLANSRTIEPGVERSRQVRRLVFRGVRVLLAGLLLASAGVYARHAMTSASSEVAYINAEMRVLRAPIEGELRMERDQTGESIPQGAALFKVHNSRSGNKEVMAQLNWLLELTDRLHAEVGEATIRCKQQEEVFKVHENLYEAKLISRLAFVEEQTKLALAQTVLSGKQAQARQAETRVREMKPQVELHQEAAVQMPFDGVAWTFSGKSGGLVAAYEPVAQVIEKERIWVDAFFHEKHAPKLRQGARVSIRALDGTSTWQGNVESVRSGVGRIACGSVLAVPPDGYTPRRVAVRVTMESSSPYDASQFYGVGRSVVVTLNQHE
jgi:multidrug resistance efflux pump